LISLVVNPVKVKNFIWRVERIRPRIVEWKMRFQKNDTTCQVILV